MHEYAPYPTPNWEKEIPRSDHLAAPQQRIAQTAWLPLGGVNARLATLRFRPALPPLLMWASTQQWAPPSIEFRGSGQMRLRPMVGLTRLAAS